MDDQLNRKKHISVKFHLNSNAFIHENAYENIGCKTATIFPPFQCVKCWDIYRHFYYQVSVQLMYIQIEKATLNPLI